MSGCIYLIKLGSFEDLSKNKCFNFENLYNTKTIKSCKETPNKIHVFKFGKTKCLKSRCNDHLKNYEFCSDFDLCHYIEVPIGKLTFYENKVKEYFIIKNFYFVTQDYKKDKYRELVLIRDEDLDSVIKFYDSNADLKRVMS